MFPIKYLRLLVLLLVLVFILSDCGSARGPYTVYAGGKILTIHPQAGTITYGKDIYRYDVKTVWGGKRYELTYPDGRRCSWTESRKTGQGTWSEGYGPSIYLPGETLVEALKEPVPENRNTYWIKQGNPAMGVVCTVCGILQLCFYKRVPDPETKRFMKIGRDWYELSPQDIVDRNLYEGIFMVIIGLLMYFF